VSDTWPKLFFRGTEVCIIGHMKRAARLAAISILVTGGIGLGGVTIASPAQAHVGGYATHGHGGCGACHDEHEKHR
jgi:hypothetical protein